MKRLAFLCAVASVLAAVSCAHGGDSGRGASPYHSFPRVQVPSVCDNPDQALDYALEHWWDGYFAQGGITDSVAVLGVRKQELEQSLSTYIGGLERIELGRAQKFVGTLLSDLERCQESEPPGSNTYLRFSEMVAEYL